ncbi:MAG TPA: acyl-CoA dehydrogenase family protein [Myxococcota bacterium]|nr:acyl-CoA dehydrogenase family protein [Myxococcota bacterium]
MNAYFDATMRLYLEKLIDWDSLLRLLREGKVEREAEVGAYRSVLETVAALASTFERPAREAWDAAAELTPDGGARPPAHIRKAYDALRENGLVALPVAEEYGGAAIPILINGMVLEMISRADTSLMTIIGLQSGTAGDIQKFGSQDLKRTWLPRFTSGEVQGCMDLTEPQAGSDLGQISTRATDLPDGTIRVDGQKIFITNGGAEVHLVLARDADTFESSRGTTNGLSLVLVARHRPDGTPNGVRVPRLERKLGIHGSPTCEVVFEGAIGKRLGEKGRGFRAVLELMNNARLGVAAQALGIAEAAFCEAAAYANQREQFGKPVAQQPLVQSMLAKMAVNIEAARALLYRALELYDFTLAAHAWLAAGRGSATERAEVSARLEREEIRVRLLTPLCKYFATEICSDVTRDAVQVFGGIGYTMDVDAAKLHADSLIMTIYEGTSEIQASFALREMGKGALGTVFAEARRELEGIKLDPRRSALASQVEQEIPRIENATKVLFGDISYALLRAKLLAEMVIDVLAATELLRQVGADSTRLDLAESYVRRRMVQVELGARRIEQNHEGRMDRDARVLAAWGVSGVSERS